MTTVSLSVNTETGAVVRPRRDDRSGRFVRTLTDLEGPGA